MHILCSSPFTRLDDSITALGAESVSFHGKNCSKWSVWSIHRGKKNSLPPSHYLAKTAIGPIIRCQCAKNIFPSSGERQWIVKEMGSRSRSDLI